MLHFYENGSITIFNFFLSTVFETYQVCYTIFFITIEFIFTVNLKHIFCLPKKPQRLFFSWLDYQSLLNKLSVLINYIVLGSLPIIFLHPAVSHVSHGPDFSGSSSRVWVQVLEVTLITVPLLYQYFSGWLHVHFHPGVKLNDDM